MKTSSELTRQCLIFDDRASTPPHVRKFRRSTYLEPGKRYQHHGVADDYPQLNLGGKIFGVTESHFRDGAADLIRPPPMSELARMNMIKSEKIYKHTMREPLGRSPERTDHLPSKFTEGTVALCFVTFVAYFVFVCTEHQPFGVKTSSAHEPAKDLIFPVDARHEVDGDGADLYKRSHGSYAPGEQRRRGYQWGSAGVNPDTTRFGRKGDTIAFNGVSKNIAEVLNASTLAANDAPIVNQKKVEDFRNMADLLGQTKNLGQDSGSRPPDMVYGKSSGVKTVSAADVIKGKYGAVDLQSDRDLGKSIMPGFRNISFQDRVYGCPSIRSDIPHLPAGRRSLADAQNYGDDVPAQELINPPAFADLSIGPMVMDEIRPKAKILELFSRIGFSLDAQTAEAIFYHASGGRESCTINAFRNALNDFIINNELLNERPSRK